MNFRKTSRDTSEPGYLSLEESGFAEGNFRYSESQGPERDFEILERYRVIINGFIANPESASTEVNRTFLSRLYYNDAVLARDAKLRESLREKVLNSTPVLKASMEIVRGDQ